MANIKAWNGWIAYNPISMRGSSVAASQLGAMTRAEEIYEKKWSQLADEGWIVVASVTFLQSDLPALGWERVLSGEAESCPS